jgi:hypothetical protein
MKKDSENFQQPEHWWYHSMKTIDDMPTYGGYFVWMYEQTDLPALVCPAPRMLGTFGDELSCLEVI